MFFVIALLTLWLERKIFAARDCVTKINITMLSRIARSGHTRILARYLSEGPTQSPGSGASSSPPASINTNVPGLSSAVIHPVSGPVGPGVDPQKSGAYKVPEYFCYDNMSYFEAEIEMAKYRCPQPSALKK